MINVKDKLVNELEKVVNNVSDTYCLLYTSFSVKLFGDSMELGNLIFNEKFIKPYRNEKKGKIIYIIRINYICLFDYLFISS